MKVLCINNEYPPIGGGGSVLTAYIAKNIAAFHDVTVLTSSFQDLPKQEVVDGYTIIRTPSLRQDKSFSTYLELISFTLSSIVRGIILVRRKKPDVIQAFFSVPAGGTAYVLSKIFRIPYVIYLGGSDVPGANPGKHGTIYPFITPIINHILSNAHAVTACSDLLIELVHSQLPQLKVHKIVNGVDTKDFKPDPKRPNMPPIEILGVGRLIPRKGFQFLIEALGKAKPNLKNPYHVTLIGSGDYKKSLTALAKKYGILKNISFVEAVPYSHLKNYYQKAHIFCLPSLAEGMPLAMLEAMACGAALATTDVAGNQELVVHNKNGILVPPGDALTLSKEITSLINSPEKIAKMGKVSRRMSIGYDWERISALYLDIYSKVKTSRL